MLQVLKVFKVQQEHLVHQVLVELLDLKVYKVFKVLQAFKVQQEHLVLLDLVVLLDLKVSKVH